jgi:AraC-like DNA-binding protein
METKVPAFLDPQPVLERHLSIGEIAQAWGVSPATVRRLFEREPGVLAVSTGNGRHKRRYTTLRIPESVAERVHRRMSLRAV